MKNIFLFKIVLLLSFLSLECTTTQKVYNMDSIHKFSTPNLTGGSINFADFSGKKILIVNVASECGFTPQYQQLQELYEHYKDKLVIIGFPCNDFGGQEPGNGEEIHSFCQKNYGVTFLLSEKVKIKGDNPSPIYEWLTHKELNGVKNAKVLWNFHKFIIDEKGHLVDDFSSMKSPLDEDITNWIEGK
jgi:glutathione peroxidase